MTTAILVSGRCSGGRGRGRAKDRVGWQRWPAGAGAALGRRQWPASPPLHCTPVRLHWRPPTPGPHLHEPVEELEAADHHRALALHLARLPPLVLLAGHQAADRGVGGRVGGRGATVCRHRRLQANPAWEAARGRQRRSACARTRLKSTPGNCRRVSDSVCRLSHWEGPARGGDGGTARARSAGCCWSERRRRRARPQLPCP